MRELEHIDDVVVAGECAYRGGVQQQSNPYRNREARERWAWDFGWRLSAAVEADERAEAERLRQAAASLEHARDNASNARRNSIFGGRR